MRVFAFGTVLQAPTQMGGARPTTTNYRPSYLSSSPLAHRRLRMYRRPRGIGVNRVAMSGLPSLGHPRFGTGKNASFGLAAPRNVLTYTALRLERCPSLPRCSRSWTSTGLSPEKGLAATTEYWRNVGHGELFLAGVSVSPFDLKPTS